MGLLSSLTLRSVCDQSSISSNAKTLEFSIQLEAELDNGSLELKCNCSLDQGVVRINSFAHSSVKVGEPLNSDQSLETHG